VSEKVVSSTGAPQGTVPSLFLFTLYTSDFQNNNTDSAVVGCFSDGKEAEHREQVNFFLAWCENNPLILNTNKTKKCDCGF